MASSSDAEPPAAPTTTLRASSMGRLTDVNPADAPGFDGYKSDGKALLKERGELLAALQERLYAHGRSGDRRSILVLQGMDTSGKGGVVARHVVGMVDPQGVSHAD